MARRTRKSKTRRKRYSPSPPRSRTKTKTKTPSPRRPAGRRARRRRRATRHRGGRRRTQRGGCTKCPWMPLKANFEPNPSPILPPGGGYEAGCTNGLRGGYYYDLNCNGGTCHPDSTVGKGWAGYNGQIEKWAQNKFSGGRRRKNRKKSRRRRRQRKRRKSRRRKYQRGGAAKEKDEVKEDGTPVGPGVGGTIRTPPIRQAMGRLVTNVRKITPAPIKNLARGASHKFGNIKHAYYGEESGRSPDPMDQPIGDPTPPFSQKLDNLSQPDELSEGENGQPEEDVNINMAPEGFAINSNKKRFG